MLKPIFAGAGLALVLAAAPAFAQSGVFDYDPSEFGTRAAYACGPFNDDLPGGPNGEDAAVIYQCDQERDALGYGQQLTLLTNIAFSRGAERGATSAEMLSLGYVHGTPVYPFSGSLTQSICTRISAYMQNEGKNCTEYDIAGEGACYYTEQSVWYCYFTRDRDLGTRYDQPPLIE
jgi:hypothetical protein